MKDEPTLQSIELRSWRQFLVLADQLHFGRAAGLLNMTQPPLTLAVQQLERRLGVVLFERTRRSVTLTPAGQALVEPVRQLLRQAAALPVLARSATSGEIGRIRLGFISTIGFGLTPVSSASRVPSPPARITTRIAPPLRSKSMNTANAGHAGGPRSIARRRRRGADPQGRSGAWGIVA